jgi:putative transposase
MTNEPLHFGQYYHIFNRGNNRENLFVQKRNYPYFMRLYSQHILPVAETFAYCLLPNHFHLLIRTRTEAEQRSYRDQQHNQIGSISEIEPISMKILQPSRAFNNMFIAYARAFNKATNRTGVLFETPFHRKIITSDAYFYRLIVYIHLNPQKHGFVDDFRDWQWSSYRALLSDKETHLARESVLEWFDGRHFFDAFHQDSLNESDLAAFIEKGFEDSF